MVSNANDPGIEMWPYPSVRIPSHESQPSQSSTRSDINPIDPLLNHTMPTGAPRFNIPSEREATAHNTILLTRFKQHTVSLSLSVLAILLLGFSTWFIYTEFISRKPLPPALQLSTSHTIIIVNILSHLNVFLDILLLESASEALRWSLASRTKGVSITTFLALSRATGISGVANLLRVPGWHRLWCILKLLWKGLCWFLSFVLLANVYYATIYTPVNTLGLSIVAGLAPVNANSPVPPSIIDVYFQTYTKGILTDPTLGKSIEPMTCSGSDCTSLFFPGSLDQVRLANGGPNATIFEEPSPNGPTSFIVNDAPGYHVEFFPIPIGFVFDQTKDCATYGELDNEAIHICISVEGTQIYAGWSICPSSLFEFGLCLNDTSWTELPDESTVLNIGKRYATVAYDVGNFSILSIEAIGDPEPITSSFTAETVANLSQTFKLAFSPVPSTFNTSDVNFTTYASSWSNYYTLSWALRLYQDDYRNYPGGPLDVLKSFLAIPIQFSTTAWQWAAWDTLPSDLYTTGVFATSSSRVLGKPWVLIAFAAGSGSLILSSAFTLMCVVVCGPLTPNSSMWSELDIVAKCHVRRMARMQSSHEGDLEEIEGVDLESFSRQNGLGNGTSNEVRACIQERKVYVGASQGSIVVTMTEEGLQRLEAGRGYY